MGSDVHVDLLQSADGRRLLEHEDNMFGEPRISKERVAMTDTFKMPVLKHHEIRGAEQVAEIDFGDVLNFYAHEGFQILLVPILDKDTGALIGFEARPYPASFEMQADF